MKMKLKGDFEYLKSTWEKSWIFAPLFDDVKPFFEKCPCPIYVITNDGTKYIKQSMEDKGLNPVGIISAEDVRAFKPHSEIFEEALRVSGRKADEVVHIGDSVFSDVKGAIASGIRPILVDRKNSQECDEAIVVDSLIKIIDILKEM